MVAHKEFSDISRVHTKNFFAVSMGSAIEFYEFTILGFLAPSITQYFSLESTQLETSTYLFFVYAIGFVFRPVGAILFGYLSDQFSRRYALYLSAMLMCLSSIATASLPQHGIFQISPLNLLLLLRIVQGISVGGEFGAGMIFFVENATSSNRGFAAGLMNSSCVLGALLGALVGSLVLSSGKPEFYWRLAILGGAFVGIIAFWLRRDLQRENQIQKPRDNIRACLSSLCMKKNILIFLTIFFSTCVGGLMFHMSSIFLFNIKEGGPSYSILGSVISVLFAPFFGHLCDRFDASFFTLLSTVSISLIFALLCFGNSVQPTSFLVIVCFLAFSAFIASVYKLIFSSLVDEYRTLLFAIPYTLGTGLAGFGPSLASLFFLQFKSHHAFMVLFMSLLVTASTFCVCLKIKNRKSISGQRLLNVA